MQNKYKLRGKLIFSVLRKVEIHNWWQSKKERKQNRAIVLLSSISCNKQNWEKNSYFNTNGHRDSNIIWWITQSDEWY
jgi:hypothetical protein